MTSDDMFYRQIGEFLFHAFRGHVFLINSTYYEIFKVESDMLKGQTHPNRLLQIRFRVCPTKIHNYGYSYDSLGNYDKTQMNKEHLVLHLDIILDFFQERFSDDVKAQYLVDLITQECRRKYIFKNREDLTKYELALYDS